MSQNKSDAARINGAKSKGPVTAEGRARSSRNALKHGLRSDVVVLPHEDRAAFESMRDSYMDSFQPIDQPQHDLVETMAISRWRLNRLMEMEAKIFEKEMVMRDLEILADIANTTKVEELAWVFDNLANKTKSITTQIRYEGCLNRAYDRAFKQLQQLQQLQQQRQQQLQSRDRKGAAPEPPEELPNEPKLVIVALPTPLPNEPNDLEIASVQPQNPGSPDSDPADSALPEPGEAQ